MNEKVFYYRHSQFGVSKLRDEGTVVESFQRDEHDICLEITNLKSLHRIKFDQEQEIEVTGNSSFSTPVVLLDGSSLSSDYSLNIRLICSGGNKSVQTEAAGTVKEKDIFIDFKLPYTPWFEILSSLPERTEKITIKAKSILYYSLTEKFSIIVENENFKGISLTEFEIHRNY